MSISSILNNSTNGITANTNALELTSENIANVNTEGYSRRVHTFDDMNYSSANFGSLSGSTVSDDLTRVTNSFITEQYLTQNSSLSKYEMDSTLFNQIEDIFGEPEDSGIDNQLDEFWAAWGDLAANPESDSARMVVVSQAEALTTAFNRVNEELTNLKDTITTNISSTVSEVNNKLEVLAEINKEISANNSDTLMDERDKIVAELSDYFEITTSEGDHGEITVAVAGQILVSNDQYYTIEAYTENTGADYDIGIRLAGSSKEIDIQSGELGSMMSVANDYIPDYLDRLDEVAVNLTQEVNNLHTDGYNLDDQTGILFFNENTTGAANFSVTSLVQENPYLVASSSFPGEAANSDIALQISELQNTSTLKGVSVSEYYTGIVTDIGTKVQQTENLYSSQETIVASIENQRDSISGVSLDEELVNLSVYQQAYQASAKVLGTVQDMVDTILALI